MKLRPSHSPSSNCSPHGNDKQSNRPALKLKPGAQTFRRGALVTPKPPPPITAPPTTHEEKRFGRSPVDARAFFFIWRLDGRAPRMRHATLEAARVELHRLQATDRAGVFVLYRATAMTGLPK